MVPVSKPLTLVMKCKSDALYANLNQEINKLLASPDNPINHALDNLGIVHFARFVFFPETKQVAVITSYNDTFENYIKLFASNIGPIFNLILEHVEGAESMRNADGKISVKDHENEFIKYVQERDLKSVEPFYSAYPDLTVQQIRQLKRNAETAT